MKERKRRSARLGRRMNGRVKGNAQKALKQTAWFWESFTPKCALGFWSFTVITAALWVLPHVWNLSPGMAGWARTTMLATGVYAGCCLGLMLLGRRLLAARA